jgi:hypothetical protein
VRAMQVTSFRCTPLGIDLTSGFILSNKFFHCDLMLSWYASPVFIWIRMPVILWKFIMHRENGVVVCT